MQSASQAYKKVMKKKWRNQQTYIRVTIGLINQQAQADAYVPGVTDYTYYSNLRMPLRNYEVKELYAACDQDYTTVNGGMYFLPRRRNDVILNVGIVSEQLLKPIEVRFPIPYDLKGVTIDFGKAYPVDFTIESDNNTVEITGNAGNRFVTEEIFEAATFLRFVPSRMVNGFSRLRIQKIDMGIGLYFDNQKILSATKREYISPIMEELPTIDFNLTVSNKDRVYDVENEESSINFLEIGQAVEVLYGQELEDSSIEWIPGTVLHLKQWSADDEQMHFSASDRFDGMSGTYYQGRYYADGISLYDLAINVFEDAGINSRTYWLDNYLKTIKVNNPMPVVTHKEALQLIANAGRCVLFQDRKGDIFIKSSFVPDVKAASDNQTYFSHATRVLDKTDKTEYAMATKDYSSTVASQYFLPGNQAADNYLNTGYVSKEVAGADGAFQINPILTITLEASYKCFGLTLEFGKNHPDTMVFHSYNNNNLMESYEISRLKESNIINHEFPEFDYLELEFTKGQPGNRVTLHNIAFGDRTDYELSYGCELIKTPTGTRLEKVKELQVTRTSYSENKERKQLAKELISVSTADNLHTIFFNKPCYAYSCSLTEPQNGQTAVITDSSAYYVTIRLTGITGAIEVTISGLEYAVAQAKISRELNQTGRLEMWENPLVSTILHAADLADWIGDYLKSDRHYDLQYRGEPRIDANDITFLENKYTPNLLLHIYDHTLQFNGALSGTIKARRDMGNVATAKN